MSSQRGEHGEISVFSKVADTLKKRSDPPLHAMPPKAGFTLAELLIALALLGIIAAFTIPKVLQSSSEAETNAKLRETVAALEEAWYTAKTTNPTTGRLYEHAQPRLNAVASSPNLVSAAGEVYNGMAPAHPCSFPVGGALPSGWVQLHNGVVIAGLRSSLFGITGFPLMDPAHDASMNHILCIDVNGRANPNLPGQDIFYGNFNPYGSFTGPIVNEQQSLKNFRWGNASGGADSNVLELTGGVATLVPYGAIGDGTRTPCAVVGCRLAQ